MQIVLHYLIYFFTVVGNVVVYLRGNVNAQQREYKMKECLLKYAHKES